jgi:hypothetical protein
VDYGECQGLQFTLEAVERHLRLDGVAGPTRSGKVVEIEPGGVGQTPSRNPVVDLETQGAARCFATVLGIDTPCRATTVSASIAFAVQ